MPRRYRNYPSPYEEQKTTSEPPGIKEEMVSETKYGRIANYPLVNIREAPNDESKPVIAIRKGLIVDVLGRIGDYLKVSYNGFDGFINAKYVEEV